MTYLMKSPTAALDYGVDWGSEYLAGEYIADSEWNVEPVEEGGLAIVSDAADLAASTVTVEGGVAGHVYLLGNRISTTGGRTDTRSILIRVEQR